MSVADTNQTEGPSRRRGGRERRRARPAAPTSHYRRLVNPYQPLSVLSEDEVAHIHEAALQLLASGGIRVHAAEARMRFASSGASVDEDSLMVRLDPEMVTEAVASAPQTYEVSPRAPHRSVVFGGRHVVMSPVGGPPHATDLERGRRNGTFQDFEDFTRLCQHFDVMHTTNPVVEPQDIALEFRHLEVTRAQMVLTDKIPFVYSRGRAKVTDSLEIIRIAHGVTPDEFAQAPRCFTVINTNSPRQLDVPMALGIIQFAETGQVCVITPFTLAGAMAPVSLAGALTLQHAEAMAGITLSQLVRAGAPVVYGAFTSNVDMRSGAPAFGTPEAAKAALASGQLARHIGLPWRSSAVSTSNAPDAQAGYETMMNTMGAVFGGANMIVHTAGWMESGLAASFEKFILDIEMVQMFAELFQPLSVTADEVGVDAITAVDPGGHFFGSEHTLQRFDRAFYEPIVFSRQSFEQWTEEGSLTADQRAAEVYRNILAGFEPPAMDDAIRAQLDDFVARRRSEGGALPDS